MSKIVTMNSAAGTAVSNTTTMTSLAKWSIPADTLTPGKMYLITGSVRSTATNSTDTLVVTATFGTNATLPASNTACSASAAVDQANDDVCVYSLVLHVQSTTRAVLSGILSDSDAEGSKLLASAYQILTIAAGTAYYFDVAATWSVASASNSCQAESFAVVEVV
jgi:hypothetical protein